MGHVEAAVLAVLCYAPLLLGGRGRLNADTKQYLYLDPGDLMGRARSVWDTAVAGGAVSHQTIGYLWPMGPYYWAAERLGIPDWVAQRIWIGSIQLVAALGALVLFRTLLRRQEPGHVVAALGYGLSPFVLGHVTGQSALLLPFAAFAWMVWALVRGLDDPSWRWPATFALIVTTCGSLNGSSVFFVVLGAVLWIPFGVIVLGRADLRGGITLLVRAGALTLLTQLWWLVSYAVSGRYGLPILAITETVQATSSTTSAAEALRGLGYWYFYGGDPHRAWLPDLAGPYMTSPFLLTVSFAVPVLALVLASRLRWSSRAYFALLITVGTLISTISFASPWRSPAGVGFEATSRQVDLVLSLRNTQRAGPLIALGVMGLLAAALTALRSLHPRTHLLAAVAMIALVVGALPGQWSGLIADRFHREEVPEHWYEAGRLLDEGSQGNVLELPGIDFASYRWGNTLDPVSVGLTDRSVIARELVPQGSPLGVSLLNALDRSLQEGWAEAPALAPMARLLGASTILVRNDLEFERYRTARPAVVWRLLTDPLADLGEPLPVGEPTVNRADPSRPLLDEIRLGLGVEDQPLPPVALLEVPGGDRSALSTHAVDRVLVVDGSGEGFYSAAAAGLLDGGEGVVLLGADLARPGSSPGLVGPSPRYLITDSNRKAGELWYSLRENVGATEPADGGVSEQATVGGRIDLVPDLPTTALTTVRWEGAKRISATGYGGGSTLLPEDRPSNAFDGDPNTGWRTAGGVPGEDPRLTIELDAPLSAPHLDLVQPQSRPGTQPVTEATVVLDGSRRFPITISRSDAFDERGVRVQLDGKPFSRLDIVLTGLDDAFGAAGIGEVVIEGLEVREVVVPPTATLQRLAGTVGDVPLAFVLTRLRANPAEPLRADPEPRLLRALDLPAPVVLQLSGTARLRANGDDARGDALMGTEGPVVRTRDHLPGDRRSRGNAALDGDRSTAWTTPFVGLAGQWWEAELPAPITVRTIGLDVVADDHHSLPRTVSVAIDGRPVDTIELPAFERGPLGTTRRADLPLPAAARGRTVRITIETADAASTTDWYTDDPVDLPIAIAEVTIPGVDPIERATTVDSGCRDDLLSIDGTPVPVRVTGAVEPALDGGGLEVAPCATEPLQLGAGAHVVETTPGHQTGIDLDRLVLRSPGWDAAPATATGPVVRIDGEGPGRASGTADSDGSPFWLVVDQSMSEGWQLSARGEAGAARVDGPHPVDGNAVGWLVTPAGPGPLDLSATWTPQRTVSLALQLSLLSALACLVLVVLGIRRGSPAAAPYGPPRLTAGGNVAWSRGLPYAGATALIAGLCVHPLAAVPAGLAMLVLSARPRWGRFIPPALIGLATLGVVVTQVREQIEPGAWWPGRFGFAHFLTLNALVVLGMEAVAEAVRHRQARLRREERERVRAAAALRRQQPPPPAGSPLGSRS